MVVFSDYMGPMDRNYGTPAPKDDFTNDVGVGVEDVGESIVMGLGAQNLNALASKVRSGVKAMEITFFGVGGGSGQSQTPDQYGSDKRQAIKEMAEINEMDITTHASAGVMGLAGMDQQGNFSADQRKSNVDEIKRAINFASDVSKGGSVVVHTGEFQRPISEEPWAKDPSGNPMFKMHPKEEETAVVRVVDDRTGQVMGSARKNQMVARPVWNKYTPDNERYWNAHNGSSSYTDSNGKVVKQGDYIDYEGNLVENPFDFKHGRVPFYNEDSKRFKVESVGWESFEQEARERTEQLAREQGMNVDDFKRLYPDKVVLAEEAYVQATLEANEGYARGWALQYSEKFNENLDALKELRKYHDQYERLEQDLKSRSDPEAQRLLNNLKRDASTRARELTGGAFGEIESKLPTEILEKAITDMRNRIEHEQQAAASQEQQAQDAYETRMNAVSASKYALKQSYNSYAEAGMHAFLRTKEHNFEKPLTVAMENLFPESYGGHPDEVLSLVKNSRKAMAQELKRRQFASSDEEAKKIASDHIKMTLDTNHLYMWRKYWQDDPNKGIKENDAAFKDWYLGKVKEMAKAGVIGNVHLVDGFGYQDDHLSPGDGVVPIKDVVKILKENGYDDKLIVEAGAEATVGSGHFEGVSKTWAMFGSPVYGAHAHMSSPQQQNWNNIRHSYFGRVEPPYFVVGSYVPSQDWSLWSQVQLE